MTDLLDPLLLAADILDPPPVDVFAELAYTPDPSQQRFHDAEEWDVGYGGIAGAGKSHALVMDAIRACVRWPGIQAGIFRRSHPELQQSILPKVMKLQRRLRERYGARLLTSGAPELRFANGSVLLFRYAENLADATRQQGGEYQWLGIDERQQVHPEVPEYLATRIRTGDIGQPALGIRSTFNPGGLGHAALKDRYIERTHAGVITYEELTAEDPPRPTGHRVRFVPGERSSHLRGDYWLQLAAIEDPVLRRQLAEGDWDAGAGLMFSETWRRNVHVVTPEQVPIPTGAGIVRARGVDYGMTNPFCCLWGAKLTDDLVVVYRELYERNLTPIEQAQLILRSERDDEKRLPLVAHLDPACWTQYANAKRSASAPAKSIAADYAATGVKVMRAHNDRLGGVRLVHDALRVRADGQPRLLVYDTCPNLIRQLGGLPRSATNPEDVDTHAEDHAYDALRYLLFGLLGRKNDTGRAQRGVPHAVTAGLRNRPL